MENRPSSSGRGRGILMKQLMQMNSASGGSSSDDHGLGGSTLPSLTPPLDRRTEFAAAASPAPPDSGVATGSPMTTHGRGMGRGRLIDLISNSSSSKSQSDKTEPPPFLKSLAGGRGRSILKQTFLNTTRSMLDDVSGAGGDCIEGTPGVAEITEIIGTVAVVEEEEEIETELVTKRGVKGLPVKIMSNYIRLTTEPEKGVFEYEVRYRPDVHASSLRHRLLNQHKDRIGNTKTFDGTVLYLPIKLPDPITECESTNENDQTVVTVSIIYKKKKRLADCMQLYNILFDRVMKVLNFVQFGRKRFDPSAPKLIPQHKLEVWPGYVTAVDEYEDGVMLCLDVSHRVLCQSTVLEMMKQAYLSNASNFQTAVMTALLGAIVLTRYNNRTYRIDDVKFDASPLDTFEMNGKAVSYVDYYKSQYNIVIKDHKQPMLIHSEDRRVVGQVEKERVTFFLVPEICFLTGLTDDMRKDFKVMKDIATFTRVTPMQRVRSFSQFCESLDRVPAAGEVLANWGLRLDKRPLQMEGRRLEEEQICFKNNKQFGAGRNADFGKYVTNNEVIDAIDMIHWIVIHTRNDGKYARNFVELMERNSKPMGINVSRPQMIQLDTDKTEVYVQALRKCITGQLQMVVILCPTSRDDRYAAIKKVCCSELPIPSQVINSRTLSNEAKNRSIVAKIALQMNCKMGGTLWSIKIPLRNVMICGIDTYHDANRKENSVSAFVSSLNGTFTRWYSRAVIQKSKEELMNMLCISLVAGLEAYRIMNNSLPDKIIIYRDGVGDGQLNMCKEYEIPQLQNACGSIDPNYKPQMTFIVVQKRINTRIFAMVGSQNLENPDPGCILDHTITRRNMYDFFLVPQSVRQGTVSPTHYIVVKDACDYSPDILQRLTYKLCFLYYNWPGTIRVPACCQYAHKLAFLVGQSVKRPTAESLSDKLFYL